MEYGINKGIGKSVEFRGLKAQYLFIFAGGLLAVFVVFVSAVKVVAAVPSYSVTVVTEATGRYLSRTVASPPSCASDVTVR